LFVAFHLHRNAGLHDEPSGALQFIAEIPTDPRAKRPWHTARYRPSMKRKFVLFSIVGMVAAGFAGCASNDEAGNHHDRTVGRYIDDKVLVQRVKSALGDNDIYKFDDVKVNTYQGTVQLTGFVETEDQKRKAEQVARNVHGVTSVQNQIALKSDTERVRATTDQDVNDRSVTNRNTTATPKP
jgi:hypothetical protein